MRAKMESDEVLTWDDRCIYIYQARDGRSMQIARRANWRPNAADRAHVGVEGWRHDRHAPPRQRANAGQSRDRAMSQSEDPGDANETNGTARRL